MRLKTLYLDQIKHFPPSIQEALVRETPHTRFGSDLPQELEFLRGAIVDLGFENLGLDETQFKAIMKAFAGSGLGLPGTNHQLRYSGELLATIVEPKTSAVELPHNWLEGVLVLDHDDKPSFIGRRVRPEQVGHINLGEYEESDVGWRLLAPVPA